MNYFKEEKSPLPAVLKWILTNQAENFLNMPDFVAVRFSDRKSLGSFLARKFWGLQGVSWTLRTKEEYDIAVKEGWIPIFENFIP